MSTDRKDQVRRRIDATKAKTNQEVDFTQKSDGFLQFQPAQIVETTNTDQTYPDKESIKVLREAIELQVKKSRDYQNPNSSIKQKDYYPRGVASIYDVMNTKMLRLKSVMEAMQGAEGYDPNFESLEDSATDLINYASFFVAYCRYGIEGQEPGSDIFS